MAPRISTSNWSQSSGSSWNSNGSGISSEASQGLASGSKPPISSPRTSSLK